MSLCEINDLQLLCLKCISSNFERFFIFFNSSVKENLLSCIKVIRKCYCDQLLKMLSVNGMLKDEHLPFLINKYTTEIDLQYLQNCSFCAIDERLEAVGSVLPKFSMASSLTYDLQNFLWQARFLGRSFFGKFFVPQKFPETNKFLTVKFPVTDKFLARLKNIQVLQLPHTNCSDQSFEIIADNCSQLKNLNVSGCVKVTDLGLTLLCEKNPPLEILNVENTSVTHKSLALVLKNIPSLTHLSFEDVPAAIREAAGHNDFSKVGGQTIFNLENLLIHFDHETLDEQKSVLKYCSKTCPFVKELAFYAMAIEEEHLELCLQFEKIDSLSLKNSVYHDYTGRPFPCLNNMLQNRGEKFTELQLHGLEFSVEILATCCPNLKRLELKSIFFEYITQRDFTFPRLKILVLHSMSGNNYYSDILCLFDTPVSCIISSSPNLEELYFYGCDFTKEMRDAVLCSKRLRILNFSETRLSLNYIQDLLEVFKGLSNLVLVRTGISKDKFREIMAIIDSNKVLIRWIE